MPFRHSLYHGDQPSLQGEITQTQCFRVTVDLSLAPLTPSSFLQNIPHTYLLSLTMPASLLSLPCGGPSNIWKLSISQSLPFYRSNTSSSFYHLLWDMLSGSSSHPYCSPLDSLHFVNVHPLGWCLDAETKQKILWCFLFSTIFIIIRNF